MFFPFLTFSVNFLLSPTYTFKDLADSATIRIFFMHGTGTLLLVLVSTCSRYFQIGESSEQQWAEFSCAGSCVESDVSAASAQSPYRCIRTAFWPQPYFVMKQNTEKNVSFSVPTLSVFKFCTVINVCLRDSKINFVTLFQHQGS